MALSSNQIKSIKELHSKKNRVITKTFIVEGEKLVEELLNSEWEIEALYAIEGYVPPKSFSITTVSNKDLERISMLKNPNKVLAIVKQKEWVPGTFKKVLLLDDISDPGNLGTIIRTAEWFGFDAIYCSTNTVEVYNTKVLQATMGSVFRMPVFYEALEACLLALHKQDFHSIITHLQGKTEWSVSAEKIVLIMGSESHGVSETLAEMAHEKIKIVGFGEAESLNVAVATGIMCYALSK
ncbi:MAG: TrmH family RNA methyltransferase [Flavobacteriales bacterium]|jgi:TrmH family RNA methyltransferase